MARPRPPAGDAREPAALRTAETLHSWETAHTFSHGGNARAGLGKGEQVSGDQKQSVKGKHPQHEDLEQPLLNLKKKKSAKYIVWSKTLILWAHTCMLLSKSSTLKVHRTTSVITHVHMPLFSLICFSTVSSDRRSRELALSALLSKVKNRVDFLYTRTVWRNTELTCRCPKASWQSALGLSPSAQHVQQL